MSRRLLRNRRRSRSDNPTGRGRRGRRCPGGDRFDRANRRANPLRGWRPRVDDADRSWNGLRCRGRRSGRRRSRSPSGLRHQPRLPRLRRRVQEPRIGVSFPAGSAHVADVVHALGVHYLGQLVVVEADMARNTLLRVARLAAQVAHSFAVHHRHVLAKLGLCEKSDR